MSEFEMGAAPMQKSPPGDGQHPLGWRQVLSILVCALLMVSEGFCLPSMGLTGPSLMSDLNLTRSQFGFSMTIMLAGFFVGTSAGGVLGDRYGQKGTVFVSFLLVTLAAAVGAPAGSYEMLLVSRGVIGLGLGAALPNMLALAAAQAPESVRSRVISLVTAGGAVGGLLASAMVGFGGAAVTWRTAVWVSALLAGIFLPFFLGFVPNIKSGGGRARPRVQDILFADGRLAVTLLLACANFFVAFNFNAIPSWAPALLSSRGISQQVIGLASAMVGPCAMLASFGYATLFDRGFRRTAATIALLGAAPALVLFFLARTPDAALLAMGCIGFTVVAGQVVLYAMIPAFYPPEGRATAMGVSLAASRLGAMAAPVTLGIALEAGLDQLGLLALMLPAAGIALLSVLFVLQNPLHTRAGTVPATAS